MLLLTFGIPVRSLQGQLTCRPSQSALAPDDTQANGRGRFLPRRLFLSISEATLSRPCRRLFALAELLAYFSGAGPSWAFHAYGASCVLKSGTYRITAEKQRARRAPDHPSVPPEETHPARLRTRTSVEAEGLPAL